MNFFIKGYIIVVFIKIAISRPGNEDFQILTFPGWEMDFSIKTTKI